MLPRQNFRLKMTDICTHKYKSLGRRKKCYFSVTQKTFPCPRNTTRRLEARGQRAVLESLTDASAPAHLETQHRNPDRSLASLRPQTPARAGVADDTSDTTAAGPVPALVLVPACSTTTIPPEAGSQAGRGVRRGAPRLRLATTRSEFGV